MYERIICAIPADELRVGDVLVGDEDKPLRWRGAGYPVLERHEPVHEIGRSPFTLLSVVTRKVTLRYGRAETVYIVNRAVEYANRYPLAMPIGADELSPGHFVVGRGNNPTAFGVGYRVVDVLHHEPDGFTAVCDGGVILFVAHYTVWVLR